MQLSESKNIQLLVKDFVCFYSYSPLCIIIYVELLDGYYGSINVSVAAHGRDINGWSSTKLLTPNEESWTFISKGF